MARLLITGEKGQLGRALARECTKRGIDFSGIDLDTLDMTDTGAVESWVQTHRPDALINCAAFTAVDRCEDMEDEARRVNAGAVASLASACARFGVRLCHVSTDYVFDGSASTPYAEDDPTNPQSAYGRTKLLGEQAAATAPDHLILRTAWLYGLGGKNFVEAIIRQVEGGTEKLRVVDDQVGCPTFCGDLAGAILDLLKSPGARGIFHAVDSGHTSWYGFAREILRLHGSSVELEPVGTDEFPRPAPRPAYSVLDIGRLESALGRKMPHWKEGLARYMEARCAG